MLPREQETGKWQSWPLGSCLTLLRNGLTSLQNKEGRGLPVTRIETIASDRIDPLAVGFVDGLSEREIQKYQMQPGDILFSHINSEPQIGRTALYEGNPTKLLHGMNLLLLRPSASAEARFLHFALMHLRYTGATLALASRAVGQSSINQGRLQKLQIPFPDKPEQRIIARVLSAAQRAIERQERLIALTAELKKALMHKLFTDGTRGEPTRQSELGRVPESWRTEPLDHHLSAAQYGLSAKGAGDGETFILRMTNQVNGRIVPNELQTVTISDSERTKFKVEPLDVLFNRTNSFELVGRTAIFDLPGEYVFASYLIRLRTRPDTLRSAYLNHFFNWDATQARLKGIASRAVSQSNISASRLRRFVVPLPSVAEQDDIVRAIDGVDRFGALRLRSLSTQKEFFRTLLHHLMTAQIRVHDLNLSAIEKLETKTVEVS